MIETRDGVDVLLGDLARAKVVLMADGENLAYRPAKLPDALMERLRTHKPALLARLIAMADDDVGVLADLPACGRCGSLELWQPIGRETWRCRRCDPPSKAVRLLEKVGRIRRRLGLPVDNGAETMLNDLKPRPMRRNAHAARGGVVAVDDSQVMPEGFDATAGRIRNGFSGND